MDSAASPSDSSSSRAVRTAWRTRSSATLLAIWSPQPEAHGSIERDVRDPENPEAGDQGIGGDGSDDRDRDRGGQRVQRVVERDRARRETAVLGEATPQAGDERDVRHEPERARPRTDQGDGAGQRKQAGEGVERSPATRGNQSRGGMVGGHGAYWSSVANGVRQCSKQR